MSLGSLCCLFSNVTGLETCLECPERFYCEGAEGDSKKPIPCPKGHYCPAGTGKSQPKCPSGTYNPQVSLLKLQFLDERDSTQIEGNLTNNSFLR